MDRNFFLLCIWFALTGIEYAVILPTINEYLTTFNENSNGPIYLGAAFSAFSFTGLIFAPLYGRITDKCQSLKFTIVFSNLFEIGGNIMYMASKSPLMVVLSRLIAGIGTGSGSSIFGTVSKNTSKSERTSKIAQLMSVRQIGLLVGPALTIGIKTFDFHIGGVCVNSLSGVGFLMAIIWTIYSLLLLVLFKEEDTKLDEQHKSLLNADHKNYQTVSDEDVSNDDVQNWRNIFTDLFREEVIVCLASTFFIMFIETGIETLITPLTKRLFNWSTLQNSLYFVGAGVDVMISFAIMAKLSKSVSDRAMLLVGYISCLIFLAILVPILHYSFLAAQGETWVLVAFFIQSLCFIFTLPFLFAPQISLFSKVTNSETQAFNQGIRISIRGIGQILGPLWASSLPLDNIVTLVSVDVATCFIIVLMIVISYKRLKVSGEEVSEHRC